MSFFGRFAPGLGDLLRDNFADATADLMAGLFVQSMDHIPSAGLGSSNKRTPGGAPFGVW
jgi:hypothetical protein